jgi:hypothetical protein
MVGSSQGFQRQVLTQPAPAVAGDFASSNPRYALLAGPGGLVAGPNGVTIGAFCWVIDPDDADGAPATVYSSGAGPVSGFVGRNQQGLIVKYLDEASMQIYPGFGMFAYDAGDFWAKNTGAAQAVPGMKAYANFANGLVTFAAAGTPATSGSGSASSIAAETSSWVGSIADDVMTVTGSVVGTIYPGTTISGTNVASGTMIVSQLSGTTGGVGTYLVSIGEQTVASTAISGTYGLLTVGGTVTGAFAVGDYISGSSVVTGTQITALGTGTGGAGTYVVNNNTVVSSTAITAATNVETKWFARTSGLPGELVKISSTPQG